MSNFDKNKVYNVKEVIRAMEARKKLAEDALKQRLDKSCKQEWETLHREMADWSARLRFAIHDFE